MIEIIAHRGLWKSENEKNSLQAFQSALDKGFGIEIDVRDSNNKLVVSHDIPIGCEINLSTVLDYYSLNKFESYLALNIKSDGLHQNILQYIKEYNLKNYFVFDMSIPDTILYLNMGIKTYIRESEYENYPLLVSKSSGIWLDQMLENSYSQNWLIEKINLCSNLCFVSPELHKREYLSFWHALKSAKLFNNVNKIMICTDHPEQARIFFK